MKRRNWNSFAVLPILLTLAACDPAPSSTDADVAFQPTNLLELTASGMRFEGPETIKSGWTTIRLNNKDDMIHFALAARLPDGISAVQYSDELGSVFQRGYDAMMAGDHELAGEIFGDMPSWATGLTYHGGPGLIEGNAISQATTFLPPGNYVIECYIKSGGVFHSASYQQGVLAMVLPLTVLPENGEMPEPEADVIFTLNGNGLSLKDGDLKAGTNIIRVNFDTQIRYPSAVGQDVHVFKIDREGSVANAVTFMDWQTEAGLSVPAPVTFVGGINDVMPAGSHGYFTVDLEPGRYGFIAEVPDADKKGMLLQLDVPG
ncbi:hypothetical protein [Kordiimonas lacus]|uniref:DUF4382 domain-containing protein n=1 Tax=Kordiimonas lacus TaxID=637679 RepID=A0A1G7B305_9PROT|nr:hypothetical protein [Kordiimonas lacus]SDE20646.1 hypothetical protein SAMN04488071_2307 [Kordiimonas lacus]